MGGDKRLYQDDAAFPAASLLETKLTINYTILGAKFGARFLSSDLKSYFLASPIQDPLFMKILSTPTGKCQFTREPLFMHAISTHICQGETEFLLGVDIQQLDLLW